MDTNETHPTMLTIVGCDGGRHKRPGHDNTLVKNTGRGRFSNNVQVLIVCENVTRTPSFPLFIITHHTHKGVCGTAAGFRTINTDSLKSSVFTSKCFSE